jgi:hypothetical protein
MLQHISIFKIFIWMICASVSVSTISAQQINVEKFIFLENDLDARVTYPKKDQNNEVCALIKVVTKHTGFSFDIGSLGVVASEQKTGEIWVYIPRGAQKITIKHAQLGVLRNYIFPMPIESANVYEMLLTTADVEIVVKEKIIETQWLVITTEPTGANVFINDDYLGKTPYQGQLPAGDYNYRIENPQYHTQAGKIKITDKKEVLNFNLKPNFGNIYISSLPEAGMQIYLNNQNTDKTTPATLYKLNSGKHTVKLINEWYEPIEKEFDVKDEQTINTSFTMQAVFANIKIKTNGNASIEIDGKKRANGEFNDRLRKGIYTVKLKHEQYYEQEFQLIVEANKNQELSYELKPKTGTLEIVSTPFDATILLNNKNYGTSPNTIKNLLIGKYTLKIQKEGYKEVVKTFEIKENEITKIDLKLELDDSSTKQKNEKLVNTNNSASSKNASTEISYKIGQIGPAGGLVFYDKGNYDEGWRYLEAAPTDQGKFKWGCIRTDVTNTQKVVGSGKQNTALIVASCNESNIAAKICDDLILGGKDDWFLPSIDELMLMYNNLHKNNLGNFNTSTYYWSSSEKYSYYAWNFYFTNGNAGNGANDKYSTHYVRAVRAF